MLRLVSPAYPHVALLFVLQKENKTLSVKIKESAIIFPRRTNKAVRARQDELSHGQSFLPRCSRDYEERRGKAKKGATEEERNGNRKRLRGQKSQRRRKRRRKRQRRSKTSRGRRRRKEKVRGKEEREREVKTQEERLSVA